MSIMFLSLKKCPGTKQLTSSEKNGGTTGHKNLHLLQVVLQKAIEEYKNDGMKQFQDADHKMKFTILTGEDDYLYGMIVMHQVIYQAEELGAGGFKEVLLYI